MTTKVAPSPTSHGVPLARDLDGDSVAVPDNAVGWRVRRHTGGRPRLVLGVDKQPLRLPLDTTPTDLEDMLGPGTYRLDIVDGAANLLGVTVQVTIGQAPEPSNDEAPAAAMTAQTLMPPGGSDVRLVLEANVRAMQSTFAHNQKTLETSLRVVESLRDGVRALADAQAVWIRSLADTKTLVRDGVPIATRNAGVLPAGERDDDDVDGDEDGEDDEEERNSGAPFWFRHLEPLLPMIPTLVTSLVNRRSAARNGQEPPDGDDDEGFKVGDLLNWQRAHEKGNARRARRAKLSPTASSTEETTSTDDGATSPEAATPADEDPAAELGRGVGVDGLLAALPAPLMNKLLLVRKELSPDEERAALAILAKLTSEELPAVVAELIPKSVAEIAATLRGLICTAAPTPPPSKASD